MARILLTPQRLDTESSRLIQAAADMNCVNSEIARIVSSLDWQVRSRGNVESLIGRAASDGKTLATEVERLGQYLRTASQTFQEADANAKTRLEETTCMMPISLGSVGGVAVAGGIIAGLVVGGNTIINTGLIWIRRAIGILPSNDVISDNPPDQVVVPGMTIVPFKPVPGGHIMPKRGFGAYNPKLPGDVNGHEGIDISGQRNDPVYASTTGKVVRAGWSSSYGNVVYVDTIINGVHYQIRYAHLDKISDEVLEALKSGKPIGSQMQIGNMGDTPGLPWCDGVHLHFEVRQSIDGNLCPIDPEKKFFNMQFASSTTVSTF